MGDFLALKQGIIYGPVASRRFGLSLGINLSPSDKKFCSMNCAYCQYGPTEILLATAGNIALPSVADVVRALEQALQQEIHLNQIAFSGNGEPTLHPDFPELVERVIELRNQWVPKARTALLSNGSMLHNENVRAACAKLDRCVVKVDCGRTETFLRYNRPAKDVTFETILEGARALPNFYTETMLTGGKGGNSTPEERAAWMEIIKELKPREAHIYSIDRPPAVSTLKPVAREMLEKWAREATEFTGVPVRAF
jgi:wyosine [tRNA(Phe)-imidazoG37] synthetase (radical SAM superfamily)